uniref:ABCF3 PWI-like helical bundle domain-containing protein n=1 Tax=Neogobius melanostomus TaxID=47308 RepID=A0A8C6SKB5_9GOBI
MASYVDILKSEFPEIDTELFDYITGVLENCGSDFEDGEEVFEAVGGVLQEVSPDVKNEDDVPLYVPALARPARILSDPLTLCVFVQTVDAKKLEKAEAKLKAKHERRNEKDSQKSTVPVVLEEASASQSSSKKDSKVDLSGKNRSYDIRIENFDVSFGERVLLQGADLSLAFGRSRSLRVPGHISILHVEQEVEGDDTRALDSVLQSDTVREGLLREERALNARINNGT